MPQQRTISGTKSVGVCCLVALYLLHWPGAYTSHATRGTAFGLMALTLGVWFWDKAGQPGRGHWTLPRFTSVESPANISYGILSAFTLVLFFSGYALLHSLDGNYFNQDDNFSQFGPIILSGVKSLLKGGVFPNWTPYQFLGSPVGDVGTYALTYPPTYLAVGLAVSVFHSPAFWVDLFFLLHAIPAVLVLLRVFRALEVTPALSVAGTLAYIFCGYNLIAGRSWFYMIPITTTLPLMAWLLLRLENHATPRWLWTAALTTGISFHSGNTQMWFYWVLFLGIGVLMRLALSPELPPKAVILRCSSAFLMGLGLALPLLLPQLQFISTVKRFPWGLGHIADNLWSLVLPYPFLEATYPTNHLGIDTRIGQIYYASSVLTLVAIALSVYVYIAWLQKKRISLSPPTKLFLGLGWVAFALCLGEFGIVWRLLSFVPPFSLFSHPFKLILYLHFFWILAAVHFLSRVRVRWDWAIAVASIALTGYHLTQCTVALYTYGDRQYSALPAKVEEEIRKNGQYAEYVRVDSNSPHRHRDEGYVHSLVHNFPSVYGIAGTWGYDPLVLYSSGTRELYNSWTHARCGDDEIRVPPFMLKRIFRCNGTEADSPEKLEELLRLTGTSSRLTFRRGSTPLVVRKVEHPDPIVFGRTEAKPTYPYRVSFAGIDVENNQPASTSPVVLNFMWRKPFEARADGRPVALDRDEWGRLVARPQPGWKNLTVRYRPQWALACGIGLFFFLIGLAASTATRKFR